jgi:chemotaxis protein MotB
MKSLLVVGAALFVLGGCATQESVEIVERECREAACLRELATLKQRSRDELARCDTARLDAERRAGEQADAARQWAQRHAQQQRDMEAELAACRAELASRLDAAQAELAACQARHDALRQEARREDTAARQLQRMKDLEDSLRQRLHSEIGAKDVEIERLRAQLSVRVLNRILFHSGSAEILPQGRKVLESVAAALADGDETIRIEGHTDTVPIGPALKRKYYSNWELSTARASSVVRHFTDDRGIAPIRLEAVGFSKYRPLDDNATADGRQRNRRVEIVLTPWKPVIEECPP